MPKPTHTNDNADLRMPSDKFDDMMRKALSAPPMPQESQRKAPGKPKRAAPAKKPRKRGK